MTFGDFTPELRFHIASYLDRSDALSLASAHSSWQDAAEAVLWREVKMPNVDVPDLWWTGGQLHKLDAFLRRCYIRLCDAIFSRPARATMIREFAFVLINDVAGLIVELARRSLPGLRVIQLSPICIDSEWNEDHQIHRVYEQLATLPPSPSLTRADLYLSGHWHAEIPIMLRLAPRLSYLRFDSDRWDYTDLQPALWPTMPVLRTICAGNLTNITQGIIDKLLVGAPEARTILCQMGGDDEIDFRRIAEHSSLAHIQLSLDPEVANAVLHRVDLSSVYGKSVSAILHDLYLSQDRVQPFISAPHLSIVTWETVSGYRVTPRANPVSWYKADLVAAQSGSSIGWLSALKAAPKLEQLKLLPRVTDSGRTDGGSLIDTAQLDILRYQAGAATVFELNLWEILANGQRYRAAGVVMHDGCCVPYDVWQQVVKLDGLDDEGRARRGHGGPLSDAAVSLLRGEAAKEGGATHA